MTTTERSRRESRGSEREDSPFATWRSSWRVAIRMGRRDVRRHRGRSALIVVMVFLPVVAVIVGVVLISTQQVSSPEQLPLALGGAVGMVTLDGDGTVASNQEYDAQPCQPPCLGTEPPPRRATPVPGWSAGGEAAALQALTGGAVARVTSSSAQAVLGQRRVSVSVLGADVAAHPFLAGRATLLSGRWPTSADEAVVTPVGSALGLPTSGQVTAVPSLDEARTTTPADSPAARVLTVVGTATAFTSDDTGYVQPADLVTLPDALGRVDPATGGNRNFAEPLGVQYLLDRPRSLTSAEVSSLNDHGLRVVDERLAASYGYPDDYQGGAFSAYTALVAVGLLLLTSLLAGPAFAVSAARQRRTLALAAANGATTAQVRRTVLGQALVLGVLAALLGGAVGLGGSWLLLRWLAQHQPGSWWGPYDVPAAPVAIVVGSAVVSSVVAAVLPARGLGRLDVVRVMRGQEVSTRLHRGLPVVGALLLLGGTGVMAWGFTYSDDTSQPQALIGITSGVLMMVVGALAVIPAALAGLGRLTRSLPVTVRMATRDAARQRGRATPTVAAVMAAGAVLTTVLVVTASSARHDRLAYEPSVPAGTASLVLGEGTLDGDPEGTGGAVGLATVVHGVAPGLRVSTIADVSGGDSPSGPSRVVAALRTGCPVSAVTDVAGPIPVDTPTTSRCTSLSSLMRAPSSAMLVADADYLTRALDLDERERDALDHGALLVVAGPGRPPRTQSSGTVMPVQPGASVDIVDGTVVQPGEAAVDIVDGTVAMVDAQLVDDPGSGSQTGLGGAVAEPAPRVDGIPRVTKVPALALDRSRFTALRAPGAVLTPATASAHGWPTTPSYTAAWDPAGAISPAVQGSVQAAFDRQLPGARISVEHGYDGDATLQLVSLLAIGVVAFLTLVATLIATALSQAESQAFSGTLAAVGATRGTRRRIAGAQAGFLALAGVLLGVVVGLTPGVLTARMGTTPHWYDTSQVGPTVVVPWLELLAPLLVVPLAAALVAAASIRATPTVTRRLT